MKLHLPVRLFRAVVAVMAVASASLTVPQAYAVSKITYEGYTIEESSPSDYVFNTKGAALSVYENTELNADASISFLSNTTSITYNGFEPDYGYYGDVGGAVNVSWNQSLTLNTPGTVLFDKNTTQINVTHSDYSYSLTAKGAISGDEDITVSIINAQKVAFSENRVIANFSADSIGSDVYSTIDLYGGAVSVYCNYEGYENSFTISDSSEISFVDNAIQVSTSLGGAIESSVYLRAAGGAVAGDVNIIGGDKVVFSDNKIEGDFTGYNDSDGGSYLLSGELKGGAIYGGTITFSGTGGELLFSDNQAYFKDNIEYSSPGEVFGGAIYAEDALAVQGYDSVEFSGNIVSTDSSRAYGGAIYCERSYNVPNVVRFSNNNEIIFKDNFAGNSVRSSYGAGAGGAIYGDTVILVNNGDVVFRGNVADQGGAAIDASHVIIQNNDSVVFRDNFQSTEYGYCSGSIYADTLVLSAAKDKSIEIRESISVSNLEIGNSYSDESGITLSQMGSVIFNGADAEKNYKQAITRASSDVNRTFAVTNTTLNGGSLILADRAILTSQTLTTTAGSGAVLALQNGVLDNTGGTYTINRGTTLSLSGKNKATVSSLQLCRSSLLSFTLSDIHARRAALAIRGDFDVEFGAAFIINFDENAKVYSKNALITLVDSTPEELSWDVSDILLIGPGSSALSTSSLYWEDNTLYVSFNDLPTYQTQVVYVDEASDITGESDKAGDFIFRVQDNVAINVSESHVMERHASWSFISDDEENPASLSFSSYGTCIFDMGDGETFEVEGLSRFALDYSSIDDVAYDGNLMFVENGSVAVSDTGVFSLSNNNVHAAKALVYLENSRFDITNVDSVEIKQNHVHDDFYVTNNIQGALLQGNVYLSNNKSIDIRSNWLSGMGGMLFGCVSGGNLVCDSNEEIYFDSNSIRNSWYNVEVPDGKYPYIYMMGGVHSGDFVFSNNAKITFNSNNLYNLQETSTTAVMQNSGGALFSIDSPVQNLFENNKRVEFIGNSITAAITSWSDTIGNHLTANGGAIQGRAVFENNESLEFKNNYVSGSLYTHADNCPEGVNTRDRMEVTGGFISTRKGAEFNRNNKVAFNNNYTIVQYTGSSLFVNEYDIGESRGGAICGQGGAVKICDNNEVSFADNYVRSSGVAIRTYGGAIFVFSDLYIQNNDSVFFSKNYEKTDAGYRLRSIAVDSLYDSKFVLSAAQGGNITIEDSIGVVKIAQFTNPVSDRREVQFNNVYVNDVGESIAQTGDIIITGLYTEEHLKEIKGGVAGTAEEILNSRTSEIRALTKLYDGRLRIEDGAIYKGFGLTAFSSASAQSNPTVLLKNGEMNHDGYSITLNAGARLELSGTNTISADNMQLNNGAGFVFNVDNTHLTTAALSYTGALTLGGELVICINAEDGLTIGNTYKLMTVTDATATDAMSWDGTHITIQTGNGLGVVSNDLIWQDNVLYLNYTGTPTINELKLTWLGGKKAVWQNGHETLWENALGDQVVYRDGDLVTFTQDTVEIVGEVQPGLITLAPEKSLTFKTKYDKKAGKWSGSIGGDGISVTIAGGVKGKVTMNDGNTYTGITSIESGTVNVGGATSFGKSSIAISGGKLDLKSKEVANDIELTGSAIIKGGKKYVGTYSQTGGELMKGSVLHISESADISGGVVNGTLSGVGKVTIDGDVELGLTGKITTDKLLVNGSLSASTKGLAMNAKTSAIEINGGMLTSKGKISSASLKLNGGSLSLSGALSVKDLTLGSGTLTLDGAKLATVKVGNSLTLEGGTTLNLAFSVKEKDVAKGKSYKVFTFKTIDADITNAMLNELLGLGTDAATLAFDSKRKAITLTVTDAGAWNEYAESVRNGTWTATPSEDDELTESAGAFMLARPAAAVDPLLGKVADTLVQSTWGTAGASRSFGDTIAARGTHATEFANGKGTAWISTMGGSSRISSDGAHAGADYTLTGAAFGMEARLSEKSTVGLAIGNSWGKVSTFSAFPVDQDSTHQGIYGKHHLGSSTTLSWMAAHTRTESDAKLAGMACDWTQDALQLDARVDKLFAISDRTTVSAFVGMQFLATDKGECNGLSTGSLQNLRGEIGVSAAHKATDKAYIYGELSFIGDMVRNNPTATVGDYRSRGANPGRAGLNLSVGASYKLNDSWSLNGSYGLELMQNQTSHSANVGATYSF